MVAYFGSFTLLVILALGFKVSWAGGILEGWLIAIATIAIICFILLCVLESWDWIVRNPTSACVSIGRTALIAGATCVVVGLVQDVNRESVGWVQGLGWIMGPIGFVLLAIGKERAERER
ncbi:MAG: hypothetical protein AB9869_27195 [Verrucomicrobiia bacterium]